MGDPAVTLGGVAPMLDAWIGAKGVILRGGGLDEAAQAYRRLPDVLGRSHRRRRRGPPTMHWTHPWVNRAQERRATLHSIAIGAALLRSSLRMARGVFGQVNERAGRQVDSVRPEGRWAGRRLMLPRYGQVWHGPEVHLHGSANRYVGICAHLHDRRRLWHGQEVPSYGPEVASYGREAAAYCAGASAFRVGRPIDGSGLPSAAPRSGSVARGE